MFRHIFRLVATAIFFQPLTLSATECEVTSFRTILQCISARSPEIAQSEIQVQISEAEITQARQIRNPELEGKNLWNNGDNANSEARLLIPIEIGGGRSARTNVAKANRDISTAKAQMSREQTLVRAARTLHRLRQIDTEIFLADEAIERFEKIVSTFRKRPQLNPEQSVSLTIIKYALEDERQKRAEALAEQSTLNADVSILLGEPIKVGKQAYPAMPAQWPAFKELSIQNGAEAKHAEALERQGQADAQLTKAESWPILKVGPSYERQNERGQNEEAFGVGVSLELPIFNQNGGGRKSGELTRKLKQIESKADVSAAKLRLESLLEQYSTITKALSNAPSQNEIEKGHRAFEAQFNKGLVSYSLIIEAHRQMHETVETKHRQELNALNILWSIYQITGQMTVEVL